VPRAPCPVPRYANFIPASGPCCLLRDELALLLHNLPNCFRQYEIPHPILSQLNPQFPFRFDVLLAYYAPPPWPPLCDTCPFFSDIHPPPISFMFSCLIFYISHQSVWAFATPRLTFGCFERLYCQLLFCPMQSATQSLQPTLCLLFFCCCILITDAITITLAFYTLYFLCNSLISSFIIMHLILSFHLCVLIFIRFSPTIVLI
jgi:hypothetical protein